MGLEQSGTRGNSDTDRCINSHERESISLRGNERYMVKGMETRTLKSKGGMEERKRKRIKRKWATQDWTSSVERN